MSATFEAGSDLCLSVWRDASAAAGLIFPPHARVLEIGCAEADWITPMLAVRPDLQITGVDWRAVSHPQATILRGDILTTVLPPRSFDAVVLISALEHIGLGHYDADPRDPDGDRECLARVREWLAPGGWVYFDVPWHPDHYEVRGTECRVYDDAALRDRLQPGYRERWRSYADMGGHLVADRPSQIARPFEMVACVWTPV